MKSKFSLLSSTLVLTLLYPYGKFKVALNRLCETGCMLSCLPRIDGCCYIWTRMGICVITLLQHHLLNSCSICPDPDQSLKDENRRVFECGEGCNISHWFDFQLGIWIGTLSRFQSGNIPVLSCSIVIRSTRPINLVFIRNESTLKKKEKIFKIRTSWSSFWHLFATKDMNHKPNLL